MQIIPKVRPAAVENYARSVKPGSGARRCLPGNTKCYRRNYMLRIAAIYRARARSLFLLRMERGARARRAACYCRVYMYIHDRVSLTRDILMFLQEESNFSAISARFYVAILTRMKLSFSLFLLLLFFFLNLFAREMRNHLARRLDGTRMCAFIVTL